MKLIYNNPQILLGTLEYNDNIDKLTIMIKKLLFLFSPIIAISQSTAIYDISVTTIWNTAQHTSIPGNTHWSDLIGATHNAANQFMEVNQLASLGIKDVAERGINTAITNEINAAIANNLANQLLQDNFSPYAGNDSVSGFNNITVNEAFPLVTLVSMVAPSPDWFIAVNSLNLRSGNPTINNGWKETFTVDVFVYDAGTDSGTNYTSPNAPTQPSFDNITLANGLPTNGHRMATMTFTFKSSLLSTTEFESVESARLFPNPVSASETVSILNSSRLKRIDVYDTLGKHVKFIVLSGTEYSNRINISGLRSGIYLLRLTDTENRSSKKKLIIN